MNDYSKEREWSLEAVPYRKSDMEALKRAGIVDKLKTPKDGGDKYLILRQKEFKKDGDLNDPITVKDIEGNPWTDAKKLIGNGSIADVKFNVVDYGATMQKGTYLKAVRVLEHVPYNRVEFAPLSEDDEFFAGDTTPETAEGTEPEEMIEGDPVSDVPSKAFETNLDDDVPF